MSRCAFLVCLFLLPLALLSTGCAPWRPAHLTVYVERSESETIADRKGRTVGSKIGASATFDLPQ